MGYVGGSKVSLTWNCAMGERKGLKGRKFVDFDRVTPKNLIFNSDWLFHWLMVDSCMACRICIADIWKQNGGTDKVLNPWIRGIT